MAQKLLVLDLDGTFKEGFRGQLEVFSYFQGPSESRTPGGLSSNRDLLEQYRQWQVRYSSLENLFRALVHSDPEQVTNSSSRKDAKLACSAAAETVKTSFNKWLNDCPEFKDIRDRILACGQGNQIWIRTNSVWLQRLIWEQWDVIQRAGADIALVPRSYHVKPRPPRKPGPVRILVIFGHATDLQNFDQDRQVLEETAKAAGAILAWERAPAPARFNAQLREGHWDMLFFSGHSASTKDGMRCDIQLTQNDQLQISNFRYAMRDAANNGLRLAMFNSCDGVGLLHQLMTEEGIALPNLVFMREKLPDAISSQFLEYFLKSFTDGESLCASVRVSQGKLHDDCEKDYPCADWLPVVAVNPSEPNLTWQHLGNPPPSDQKQRRRRLFQRCLLLLLTSILTTEVVAQVRLSGALFPLEAQVFDWTQRLRRVTSPDDRFLIIGIDEKDIEYQDQQGWERSKFKSGGKRSLSGQALSELLKKLEPAAVIGLDIFRPISSDDDYPPLKAQLVENDKFIGVCGDRGGGDRSLPPPPELSLNQVGFADMSTDTSGIEGKHKGKVRRFLFAAKFGSDTSCLPSNKVEQSAKQSDLCSQTETPETAKPNELKGWGPSFALIITQRFLEKDGRQFSCSQLQQGIWELEDRGHKLQHEGNSGFYRGENVLEKVEGGRQVLFDFRRFKNSPENIAQTVSLKEFLEGNRNPKIEGKIVLIGITKRGEDDFLTPFSRKDEHLVSGVYLHAHAISQLLDVFENGDRPVLRFWPDEFETSFYLFWIAIAGGMIPLSASRKKIISLIGGSFFLIGVSYGVMFYQMGISLPVIPGVILFCFTGVCVASFKKISTVKPAMHNLKLLSRFKP